MQPVVHLAVGYLCYAAYVRLRGRDQPGDVAVLVAVFAAVLPDLIDQPLAIAGVTDVGRTMGHSLLFAIPLVFLVWFVTHRREHPTLGVAFAIGYASHIAADIPWHVIAGDYHELGFLLWPVTDMPSYSGVKYLGTVSGFEVTTLWLEAVIFVGGIALWWADGRPGFGAFRQLR